eukprot:7623790-Lingulodinium_polyedra.AAC.1
MARVANVTSARASRPIQGKPGAQAQTTARSKRGRHYRRNSGFPSAFARQCANAYVIATRAR